MASFVTCDACGGDITISDNCTAPTVHGPMCGAVVAVIDFTTGVMWCPPTKKQAAPSATSNTVAPGWIGPWGTVLVIIGGLAFWSSAAHFGALLALLNPLVFIGLPLGFYWLKRAGWIRFFLATVAWLLIGGLVFIFAVTVLGTGAEPPQTATATANEQNSQTVRSTPALEAHSAPALDARLDEQKAKAWIARNSSWICLCDAWDKPIRDAQGKLILTPDGTRLVQYIQEAEQSGIKDVDGQIAYAMRKLGR